MIRIVTLALLPLVLANWTQLGDTNHQSSDTAQVAETAVDASDQAADRDMVVGRYYVSKRDYTAAYNRFKTIVSQYPASPYVEETVALLVEIYLHLGIHKKHKPLSRCWSANSRTVTFPSRLTIN
jgi:outer membrane protein assembly factor BamD (BamD/ComL family)